MTKNTALSVNPDATARINGQKHPFTRMQWRLSGAANKNICKTQAKGVFQALLIHVYIKFARLRKNFGIFQANKAKRKRKCLTRKVYSDFCIQSKKLGKNNLYSVEKQIQT